MDSDQESSPNEESSHVSYLFSTEWTDDDTESEHSNYSDHTPRELNDATDISTIREYNFFENVSGDSYIKSLSEKQLLELLNKKITPVEFSKYGAIFFKLNSTNQHISERNISSICWIKNISGHTVELKVEYSVNKTYSIINFPTGYTYGILKEYENESVVDNSVEISGKKIVLVPGIVYNYCSLICQKVNLL